MTAPTSFCPVAASPEPLRCKCAVHCKCSTVTPIGSLYTAAYHKEDQKCIYLCKMSSSPSPPPPKSQNGVAPPPTERPVTTDSQIGVPDILKPRYVFGSTLPRYSPQFPPPPQTQKIAPPPSIKRPVTPESQIGLPDILKPRYFLGWEGTSRKPRYVFGWDGV